MATYTGNAGIIKIGDNAISEVKEFSITETIETVEDTVKGDNWRTYKGTFKSWTGETTVLWDDDDATGQDLCVIGAELTIKVYSGGDSSGKIERSGTAIISERNIESPEDGIVPMKLTIQGTGELVQSTVT